MKRLGYHQKTVSVKPRMADLRKNYPLMCGFRNLLINALPFALIWLAAGVNMLVASLSAFFMMLLYCLRENHRNNKRLSEMARRVAAAVSEQSELTDGDSIHKKSDRSKEQGNDNAS